MRDVRKRLHSTFSIREFEASVELAVDALRSHLEAAITEKRPVVAYRGFSELRDELRAFGSIAKGGMTLEGFRAFLDWYLEHSVLLQHPGYIALQGAVPHHLAAASNLVKGVGNSDSAVYEMGPASVVMELEIIRWMLGHLGWSDGDGVLTNGGSLGNLTGLLAARAHACPESWEEGARQPVAVLAPASAHYSVARAVAVLGLGARAVVPVAVDGNDVLRSDALPAAYESAAAGGRRVIAVVATAAATATGLYDPLEETGRFCRERDLWFHIDAAHGGAALLPESTRHLMAGAELADSLIWNAHKMLQTSVLCTAVLYRNAAACAATFAQQQSYLEPDNDPEHPNLFERSFECSKGVLSLKVYPGSRRWASSR